MSAKATTSNGSTLYQVKLSIVEQIIANAVDTGSAVDGDLLDNLHKFIHSKKGKTKFMKATFKLDKLTGIDVSGAIEKFEDEQEARRG
tara:strand:+ start:393 stop:656 length:264 start_codon:yes stop_codon:yes gene_type:complete